MNKIQKIILSFSTIAIPITLVPTLVSCAPSNKPKSTIQEKDWIFTQQQLEALHKQIWLLDNKNDLNWLKNEQNLSFFINKILEMPNNLIKFISINDFINEDYFVEIELQIKLDGYQLIKFPNLQTRIFDEKQQILLIENNKILGFHPNNQNQTKLIIPPFVTEILPKAFENNQKLEIIDFSLLNSKDKFIVGYACFKKCINLKQFLAPKQTQIKFNGEAFSGCTNLQDEALNQILFSIKNDEISYHMFRNCTSISTLVLPKDIIKISTFAFENCQNLKLIYVSKNSRLKWIDEFAFMNCINLEDVQLNDHLSSIYKYAFSNCQKIKRFKYNTRYTVIHPKAFEKF